MASSSERLSTLLKSPPCRRCGAPMWLARMEPHPTPDGGADDMIYDAPAASSSRAQCHRPDACSSPGTRFFTKNSHAIHGSFDTRRLAERSQRGIVSAS